MGFIRPFYWENLMPAPPSELSDLHFKRVTVPSAADEVKRSFFSLDTLPSRADIAR